MEKSHGLANRFREVILNGTWIANTNYKDQLTNTRLDIANKKLGALNAISVLAQHIHYYINGIKNVFKGGNLDIKDSFSFDFPPIASQSDWELFLEKLWADTDEFANLVEQMSEEKLNENFVDEKYGTYHRNIEGMTEHCYYHLGQIVLIKKLLQSS
ncbi:DUF1572 domain-containing protein [Confluentibacter sediminis]|uniref:DUF1572 domain-containing protein n=1 Tax=Confluentibacter sediminis TaxID=2219045 RepID=UPI000DAE072E|nr:DUF1572 domain-containing protein [Confluentibacter sediminis]